MKSLLLVTFLILGQTVFAAENDETKPLAMPDFSKVNSAPSDKSGIKVKSSCRTSTGRTISKNEPGYESCMSAAQMEISKKHGTSVGPQTGTSSGVNFEIGK